MLDGLYIAAVFGALSPEAQTVGVVIACLGAVLAFMKVITDRQTETLTLQHANRLLLHESACKARRAFDAVPEAPLEPGQSGPFVRKPGGE
jgi:hypothetical protein